MQVLKKGVDTPFHEQIGVTRGGKHTKIHAVVDGLGNPLYVQLSGRSEERRVGKECL